MPENTHERKAAPSVPGDGRKQASRAPNPLLEMMAASAGARDVDEFAEEFAGKKNKEHADAFARVAFNERILLLPQCMRSSAECKAVERAFSYECTGCGACDIPEIIAEARRLGYLGVHVLKGGRAVVRLIEELEAGAVAGVACSYEGLIGIMECERRGVPVQFVPLSRDGCADTEVDLDEIKSLLGRLLPEAS